jgi:FMN-dependent NADH-azoreductase
VSAEQLNGGRFAELSEADWTLIRPYLEENERLFGIEIAELLSVDGEERAPSAVYRKVEAQSLAVLR